MEALGHRTTEARRDVGIEPDLTLVEPPQRHPGLPARRIGRGNFQHNRGGSLDAVGIRQPDPVALTHLAGTDAVDGEPGDGGESDGGGQPLGGQVTRSLDDDVVGLHATNLGHIPGSPKGFPANS